MVTVILENGERARIYYGKYKEDGMYFCEAVFVGKNEVYNVVSPPIKSEEKAELLYGILLSHKALPMNLCGIYEDMIHED